MDRTEVLIVGAGPTGLTLACDLARRGVAFRIVDKAPVFHEGSRGKGLQPRSLELLEDLGLIRAFLDAGASRIVSRRMQGAEVLSEVRTGSDPTPDRPYTSGLLIPQWRTEALLRERLSELGGAVELGTELVGFTQDVDGLRATLRRAEAEEQLDAAYLVACEGGKSSTRKALGVAFEGETFEEQLLVVGDVELEGLPLDAWYQWFTPNSAFMLCPLPGGPFWQLQSIPEFTPEGAMVEPSLASFQRLADRLAGLPIKLLRAGWLSTYRVNVRMVDRLRVGRAFLAGDAAHVHSIAGGLGMNTGMQDAYNLGWKLAAVLGGADAELLDSYEEERLPIAAWTLSTSSERGRAVADMMRGKTPGGLEVAGNADTTQLGLGYRWSSLSKQLLPEEGPCQAGDRAPDAPCEGGRLFESFQGPHFTLLGFGEGCAEALSRASGPRLKARCIGAAMDTGGHAFRAYGIRADTLVLVRPDGYIGAMAPPERIEELLAYPGL